MSLTVNHVTFAGHLTRPPEARSVGDQAQVVQFTLANNRRFKTPSGETREEATFIDCEAWGRTGELVHQYLTKGSPTLVTGRLRLDQWEDKDGNKRSRVKILVDQVHFLGTRTERSDDGGAPGEDLEHQPPSPGSARPRVASRPAPRTTVDNEPPF